MLLRFAIILFILLSPALRLVAQTRIIDSLRLELSGPNTTPALNTVFLLCEQGNNLHSDSLNRYAEIAEQLAREKSDRASLIRALYYRSFAYTNKGQIDSSLAIADRCLQMLRNEKPDPVLEGRVLNQKGRCYMRKNQYKEAIDMGHQVIAKGERANDTLLQMQGRTLIGWAYLEMEQSPRSLQWHLSALRLTPDTVFARKYSILFANIALNYSALGKRDSAFYYIDRAIMYSRQHQNLFALSNSLAIQAQLLIGSGMSREAEASLQEVVVIRKQIGDPFYVVSDMAQLGYYYAHNGQPEKGVAICREGIAIARRYRIETKLLFLYSTLAENYKMAGNQQEYASALESLLVLKDSVYRMNSEEALADVQARYDIQKKENTIIQQKLDLTRKNYWIYGSLCLLIMAGIATFIIFRDYRRRQRTRMFLMLEQEKRMSETAVIKAEENERKRIAADLHDNLGAYAASIASNIDQISVMSNDPVNSPALHELRNNSSAMVSQLNDTIWVLKKDALSLTAISDRLKIFIQRLQPSYPGVRIDVVENIATDLLLPPSQAFHLFQVLQEAINNSLRHSGARQITISIEGGDAWEILVTDDGHGMPADSFLKGGNGLANMRNRARESGWHISWKNNPAGGTCLSITPAGTTK